MSKREANSRRNILKHRVCEALRHREVQLCEITLVAWCALHESNEGTFPLSHFHVSRACFKTTIILGNFC